MEVEQSLGAVDGVIVILDGSAGVEAQTVTVWSQSQRYQLPRMVFVNKMDRPDADFEFCLADLQRKLNASVVPVQWPIYDEGSGRLKGKRCAFGLMMMGNGGNRLSGWVSQLIGCTESGLVWSGEGGRKEGCAGWDG